MPYSIKISEYPVQLRIHSKNLFSLEIPDGRVHPDSGAILDLPEISGDFSELTEFISDNLEYSRGDRGFRLSFKLSENEHIYGCHPQRQRHKLGEPLYFSR